MNSDFMDWVKATEVVEKDNGVYMKLDDCDVLEFLVEDYEAKRIGELEIIMPLKEFEILKEVYEGSLIDWS